MDIYQAFIISIYFFFSTLSSTFSYFRTQHVRDLAYMAYHYRGFTWFFLLIMYEKGHFIPL